MLWAIWRCTRLYELVVSSASGFFSTPVQIRCWPRSTAGRRSCWRRDTGMMSWRRSCYERGRNRTFGGFTAGLLCTSHALIDIQSWLGFSRVLVLTKTSLITTASRLRRRLADIGAGGYGGGSPFEGWQTNCARGQRTYQSGGSSTKLNARTILLTMLILLSLCCCPEHAVT